MTKQTWTAAVSAVLFVVLAAVIALVPVPYVVWSPGSTQGLLPQEGQTPAPVVITGAKTYPTSGQLLMTTVSVTAAESTLGLPEVLFSYWQPSRQVLPRSTVYREGQDVSEVEQQETEEMTDSQSEAVVAALRVSGIPVISWPMVASVSDSGAASGILEPGDLIQAVDGEATTTVDEAIAAIAKQHVGEKVTITVVRGGQRIERDITTRATDANPDRPVIGVTLTTGYTYKPTVTFNINPDVGGASAGLMFSLAIADMLTEGDDVANRVVAGTGTMSADGTVGPIGGVQEKIAGAVRDGATVFVLPRENCVDVGEVPSGVRLVPVKSLDEAIRALDQLKDPATADSVAGCS